MILEPVNNLSSSRGLIFTLRACFSLQWKGQITEISMKKVYFAHEIGWNVLRKLACHEKLRCQLRETGRAQIFGLFHASLRKRVSNRDYRAAMTLIVTFRRGAVSSACFPFRKKNPRSLSLSNLFGRKLLICRVNICPSCVILVRLLRGSSSGRKGCEIANASALPVWKIKIPLFDARRRDLMVKQFQDQTSYADCVTSVRFDLLSRLAILLFAFYGYPKAKLVALARSRLCKNKFRFQLFSPIPQNALSASYAFD